MNINSEFGQADAARDRAAGQGERRRSCSPSRSTRKTLQNRLSAEGLDGLLPHPGQRPHGRRRGLRSVLPLPAGAGGLVPDTPFRIPTVRLTAAANGSTAVLEVTNVHALPPLQIRVDPWRSDLAAVARVAERPGNRLLIGDFNATYDHTEFRELLGAGQNWSMSGWPPVPGWCPPGPWKDHGCPGSPSTIWSPARRLAAPATGPPVPGTDARPSCPPCPSRPLTGSVIFFPDQFFRISLWLAACATGRMTIWSRLTWCGALTAYLTTSATSAAVSGFSTPW